MRAELTAPELDQLTTRRPVDRETALTFFNRLVDRRLGPVGPCTSLPPAPGESGYFHRYEAWVPATAQLSEGGYGNRQITGGAGFSEEGARLRATGEAVERYCLSLYDRDAFKMATYQELSETALDPAAISVFSEEQLEDRDLTIADLHETLFHWTPTRALTSGKRVLVPGQCFYLPFSAPTIVRQPISTGAAAGIDYGGTLVRAIAEVVEREAYMIGYLNALRYPRLDLSTSTDPVVRRLLADLKRMGWEVTALDATLDHPFHSCIAVGINRTGGLPVLSIGLGSDMEQERALIRAILEVYQFAYPDSDETYGPGDRKEAERRTVTHPIRSLADRRRFWNDHERIEDLSFWLEDRETVPIDSSDNNTLDDPIEAFTAFLDARDLECYITDVTTADVADAGCRVLAVFAPALQPLHLDEEFKYLGTKRLYNVPVMTNYRTVPTPTDELVSTPHPFL